MPGLRDAAPEFDCAAIVDRNVVDLKWSQVHGRQNLVLIFDSVEESLDASDDVRALSRAADRLETHGGRLAVVCRDDEFEILTWMSRHTEQASPGIGFPVILDSDNEIAAMYDMLSADGPLWGHVIADANGTLRSIVAHSFPVGLNGDELIRCVASIAESDEC